MSQRHRQRLKRHSSAPLISRYILRLGKAAQKQQRPRCPNRKMYLEIRKADEGALIFRPFRAFFISQTQRKQRNDAIKRRTKHRFDSIHFACIQAIGNQFESFWFLQYTENAKNYVIWLSNNPFIESKSNLLKRGIVNLVVIPCIFIVSLRRNILWTKGVV